MFRFQSQGSTTFKSTLKLTCAVPLVSADPPRYSLGRSLYYQGRIQRGNAQNCLGNAPSLELKDEKRRGGGGKGKKGGNRGEGKGIFLDIKKVHIFFKNYRRIMFTKSFSKLVN